jgi:hypothetical protein
MTKTDNTRVDRWIRWLKDNQYIAPLILLGICLIAISGAVNVLPASIRDQIATIFTLNKVNSGWIFLGYQNANSRVYWDEGPYAQLVGNTIDDPTSPFRAGNIITLNHDREIIIINYRKEGAKDLFTAPSSVHGKLLESDHTGSVVKAGTELLVRDVWIGHFPGADYAVWVRITPASTAD